jgi:hypothetical protein
MTLDESRSPFVALNINNEVFPGKSSNTEESAIISLLS